MRSRRGCRDGTDISPVRRYGREGYLAVDTLLAIYLAYGVTRSEYITGQTITLDQPVPFRYEHHVGGLNLGLDCRYCHTGVEVFRDGRRAADAHLHDLPFRALHLGCNSGAGACKPGLRPTGPLDKVNRLPDYVYFDHSIHIAKGVGYSTCHGAVDRMSLRRQEAPLTMGWCDCKSAPGRCCVRSRMEPRRRSTGARPQAPGQLRHRQHASHRLLGVPSMTPKPAIFSEDISYSAGSAGNKTAHRPVQP